MTTRAHSGTVLVTGGAGYIGAHACKALAARGYLPVTYDNLVTGWRDAVRFGPLEEGDIGDRARLDAVFAQWKPDAVMHFAALSQVGEAMGAPLRYWHNNVAGAVTLLEAMEAVGCRALIFSSTCAVHGEQDGITLTEESACAPLNAYGASKRAVEDMLCNAEAAYGLRHVSLRYFNVAGADPEGEVGEFHRPETHLIPVILQAIDGQRAALTLYGTDYPTPDGTCIRDYVHVVDLVEAHLAGLERLLAGGRSRVYNLGTGRGFSVREVIDAAERVTGRKVPVEKGPRRPGDCRKLVSGSARAAAELGWQLEHSTLERMISDAWRWHREGGYVR